MERRGSSESRGWTTYLIILACVTSLLTGCSGTRFAEPGRSSRQRRNRFYERTTEIIRRQQPGRETPQLAKDLRCSGAPPLV